MSKYLGIGCGIDIGGWSCGDFLEVTEDENGRPLGQYYYCEECLKKLTNNEVKE